MSEKIVEIQNDKTKKWVRTTLRFVKKGDVFKMFNGGKKERLVALCNAYKKVVWTIDVGN